ncbi:prolipoprotein diacylglyceryl transferase [Myxococcota bacterium]|nr:prolipoprotein diacylglyceryl transferase [Myxococcota bacterium]
MEALIPYFKAPPLHIGPIPLQPWGLLVATGFLVGAHIASRRARDAGLDGDAISPIVTWLVVAAAVGGHLGHALFYDPAHYFARPIEFLYVWNGLSSFGGFLAAVPVTWWYFRRRGLPFWPYADCLAYGLATGWAIGRLGCFVVHDHPGTPTEFWLGVHGICPGGSPTQACHDLGLYDALISAGIAAVFAVLGRRPRFVGFFLGWLAVAYGLIRFGLDFLRAVDARYLGLTPAQYLSALLVLVGLAVLWTRRGAPAQGRGAAPVQPEVSANAPTRR